jgi:DNA polymerase-1
LQNIPADNKFRHCFGVEEGYEVTTCDLSGAELIVMVALSGDLRLLELASGDMHSHMANMCWEKIYRMRGDEWTEADKISKKQNKSKRTDFKPMTFGVIYGMYKKKAAEQLNVHIEEGATVVEGIKKEIPDVIKMVEAAGKFALNNGYIVHNSRTNSRRWFTPVLEARKELKYMKEHHPCDQVPKIPWYMEYENARPEHLMKFLDKSDCESQARNSRIQGTQADMVKEAIVEIAQDVEKRGLDITLLGTIHDEMVYKHPIGYQVDGKPVGDYISNWMTSVANRYLNGVVEMGADYDTMATWTK